ncbi:MAG: cobalt-precorrin-5B (C(1))-methyltransferase [Pseudomonadales bacterium]|nr:cobalt-precorrin-5B (C(1))-methyltransferase [Pseudomonadales bacterium]NRA14047.1 cobalt-precorrin-5B (C(1))-methyltransferase [Oceanospirillaceae bacterium]
MWQESSETITPLRSGLTTGSCATACCVAACRSLFAKQSPALVEISLPRGKLVEMHISNYQPLAGNREGIRVSTIKDAGDDPDATHGATIFVELALVSEPGIVFKAAEGVGTVTKTGLLLDIGEPAINPVPRKMMSQHLSNYAEVYQYSGGFEVSVGVVNGEQIATKTMNGRLGILGGLSILGTTGIVRPFSCAAYIASIRQGVDVASSNGVTHMAAATGSSSEAAIGEHYQLQDMALIEMGDFVGALLKHLKKGQISKLSICGGFGKMTKLAQGALDLNSRKCSIDFAFLQRCVTQLLEQQASVLVINTEQQQQLLASVGSANTSIEVLNLCSERQLPLAALICQLAQQQAQAIVAATVAVEVFAINRKGEIIASTVTEVAV